MYPQNEARMAERRTKQLRQHEPLTTPYKWTDDERRFAFQLEQHLTDIYQQLGKIRERLDKLEEEP